MSCIVVVLSLVRSILVRMWTYLERVMRIIWFLGLGRGWFDGCCFDSSWFGKFE